MSILAKTKENTPKSTKMSTRGGPVYTFGLPGRAALCSAVSQATG